MAIDDHCIGCHVTETGRETPYFGADKPLGSTRYGVCDPCMSNPDYTQSVVNKHSIEQYAQDPKILNFALVEEIISYEAKVKAESFKTAVTR